MPFYYPLLQEFHTPIYFYTATILEWKSLLLPDHRKIIITNSLKFNVVEKRIVLYGFVIMPNHLHLLMSLIQEYTMESFKRDFGKYTANHLKHDLEINDPHLLNQYRSSQSDRKYQIWERRPLSIPIYNEKTFIQKLNYIHNNPCKTKWGLAENPEDYFYSSAKFYVEGIDDWGFITHFRD